MTPSQTILITGGTGLVGKALTEALLQKGFHVIILTRNASKQKTSHPNLSFAAWNVENKTIDNDAIAKADYIIHLAGASVADKSSNQCICYGLVRTRPGTHSKTIYRI